MPISISEGARSLARLRAEANALGFSACRVTAARLPVEIAQNLDRFIELGCQGDMAWLAGTKERRASPDRLWPEARSAIVLAMNYGQGLDHQERLQRRDTGLISVYALNRDYHELIKGRLKQLAQAFHRATGAEVKVFVDTAPIMEKPLAEQAGIGWQGKHTNLVSRQLGSWFFLGVILTAMELPADEAEADHCGTCRACLDACPTAAFSAPRKLDARRCLSYLTIEHHGHIAAEFRTSLGNRIYGCDDCLAACPWNKFAAAAREAKLAARSDLVAPPLAELLVLDEAGFRARFSGSPIKRVGHPRFLRNVLIAAGNSGEAGLVPRIMPHLDHGDARLRAMAVWALSRLLPADGFASLRLARIAEEADPAVRAEWQAVRG